jgi:capsular polysaccharide biosynthesis protein
VSEDLPNYLMDNSKYKTLAYLHKSDKSKEILNKLGVRYIDSNEWVLVKNLSFVTKSSELGYLHPKSLQALRDFQNHIGLTALNGSRNLYVSRSKTRRSAMWEKDLEKGLFEKGFEIIHAEDHSFLNQIELFRDAKNIIGVHGAGLTNAIWSTNCSIIELMPTSRINRCVEWQAKIANGKYDRIYFDPKVTKLNDITKEIDALIR